MQRPINQVATVPVGLDHDTTSAGAISTQENFLLRSHRIWNKVTLLENVGMIKDECDRFSYALRFAEVELQQACTEIAALREQLNGRQPL